MVLFIAGDIMLGRNVEKQIESKSFESLFKPIKDITGNNPLIANLESPLTQSTANSLEENNSPKFKGKPHLAKELLKNNFVAMSIANNHIFDYGLEGFLDTKKTLNNNNIKTFGAGKNLTNSLAPAKLSINNTNILLYGASYRPLADNKKAGVNNAYSNFLLKEISSKKANEKADVIIVFLHTGLEMLQYPLPRDQKLAKSLIDYGADIIIGGHPHCIQVKEKYKNKFIFYSLGDLVFDHNDLSVKKGFSSSKSNSFLFSNKLRTVSQFFSLMLEIQFKKKKIFKIKEHLIKIPNNKNCCFGKPVKNKPSKSWFINFEKLNNEFRKSISLKKQLKDIENALLKKLKKE